MSRVSYFSDQLISLDILGVHTSARALKMSRRVRNRGQHYWNKVGGIFWGNKYIKYDNMLSMPTLSWIRGASPAARHPLFTIRLAASHIILYIRMCTFMLWIIIFHRNNVPPHILRNCNIVQAHIGYLYARLVRSVWSPFQQVHHVSCSEWWESIGAQPAIGALKPSGHLTHTPRPYVTKLIKVWTYSTFTFWPMDGCWTTEGGICYLSKLCWLELELTYTRITHLWFIWI